MPRTGNIDLLEAILAMDGRLGWGLARLEALSRIIIRKEDLMAGELAVLTAEVAETKGVIQSAIVLINGFRSRLDEAIAAGNPAKLTELASELDATANDLAAAVAANSAP